MSIFEDTNTHELKLLLSQIHSREAALPDFQRDFVWDPKATQELITSIACNFPAGSLLRVRNTKNLFACREFQNAPPLNGHKPTYLVLDGQQRLTSLYQAFHGVGEHRYFLDLSRLLKGRDFEEAIFHFRRNTRQAKVLDNFDVQARDLILPLALLKDGPGEFRRWLLKVSRTVSSDDERRLLEDQLSEMGDRWIDIIGSYRFPVVTLSDSTTAEAVCTIFETLNRTGVKLSPFELLTARFWPRGVNLRQLWAEAKARYPIIADFEVDPYYVLQIVSLTSRSSPSCKRADVLDLEPSAISNYWQDAISGLADGLEILRDDCGVLIPEWMPYDTIVIPLAAVLAKLGSAKHAQVGANRNKLNRWFWCSVFGQAYENAPNSQAAKDMAEILSWCDGGQPPETVGYLKFDPRLLRDTTAKQRAVYRGVVCLVMRNGPSDFYNGKKLTGTLIRDHKVDDHHIFPQKYLEGLGISNRLRDCVLNRTLIDRHTNMSILDRPPSKYFEDIRLRLEEDGFRHLLDSHFLPAAEESALFRDDFDAFLEWRQEKLWEEIRAVTGLNKPTDLIIGTGVDGALQEA
jgi:hypothetical protein